MAESSNTQQYTVSNSDNNGSTFKLPGDNPGEAPFDLDDTTEANFYRWYVHINNGWNVNIDVTVEGSHSLDGASNNKLNEPVADGSAETVSSDSNDFIDGTTNHAKLQLDVAPAADPTADNLVVTIERRKS